MSAATWEEKFLSKCQPRSGRTKAVPHPLRGWQHELDLPSKSVATVGSAANRPKAETQPTLFANPPALTAEEIAYQRLLNESSEADRNRLLQLTGGEWMQLDLGGDS